jgi:NADP-dependent 3-hydroxy acid dehydrogenase YdfG
MQEKKLANKVAIVTGASSGIGEATALALANLGANVAIMARRADRLNDLAKRIKTSGADALVIEGDVSDAKQCQKAIADTKQKWGRIDILINNAGVMLLGPVEGAELEDWRRMVNINVLGLMYMTHAVLPHMSAQHSGHIVNISSVSGRIASAGTAVYNATKWAVGAFSEALRQEVHKSKIRVTIIEPGAVSTELVNHITNSSAKERVTKFVQSMTPLQSEDIAQAISYAVSQPLHVNVNEILIRPTEQAI